jgi:hypothetical protein
LPLLEEDEEDEDEEDEEDDPLSLSLFFSLVSSGLGEVLRLSAGSGLLGKVLSSCSVPSVPLGEEEEEEDPRLPLLFEEDEDDKEGDGLVSLLAEDEEEDGGMLCFTKASIFNSISLILRRAACNFSSVARSSRAGSRLSASALAASTRMRSGAVWAASRAPTEVRMASISCVKSS